MRIATWNIGGGYIIHGRNNDGKHPYDKPDIGYFIKQLEMVNPDAIALQESHVPKGSGPSQPNLIKKALRFGSLAMVSHADSHITKNQKLTMAIISKLKMEQSKYYKLKNPKLRKGNEVLHDKGILLSRVRLDGDLINFVTIHGFPFRRFDRKFSEPEFRLIRVQITNILMGFSRTPTIIAGDFNDESLRPLFPRLFKSGAYKEVFDKVTDPNGMKLDHILFSTHWKVSKWAVVKGLADHYLCYADLGLK